METCTQTTEEDQKGERPQPQGETPTEESDEENGDEVEGLLEDPEWAEALDEVRGWHLLAVTTVSFEGGDPAHELDEAAFREVAAYLLQSKTTINNIKKDTKGLQLATGELAEKLRKALLEEFGETAMSGKYQPNPPVRGPSWEAEIWLRPDAKPGSFPRSN